MSLLDDLQWRYATKKMNGLSVPQQKVDYILEAARLAPSSSGIQPYRIFVISNKELLKQIRAFSFNQSQIEDCSHLLIFTAWDTYTKEKISEVLLKTSRERGLPDSSIDDYLKMLWAMFEPMTQEWFQADAAKQAYISFGLAIAAAAEQKVDATPMGGFDNAKMDKFLGLEKLGLKSIVVLPLGYRDPEGDWLANLKKVRTPKEEFITEFN
jgi:nitroreductase/dihydropteridine reductase